MSGPADGRPIAKGNDPASGGVEDQFIDIRGGSSPTPDQILDTLIDWKDLLHPDFEDSGYLAILGEDEIIPTWAYTDVVGGDDVAGVLRGMVAI